jgi:methylated-DNA-[protein]-cysteine S-methyltransferase
MFERLIAHHWTPVGWITLMANHLGLFSISYGKQLAPFGRSDFLDQSMKEIDEFFTGKRTNFTVPLHLVGSPFQKVVWSALKHIPYGALPTYSDIAAAIGRPSAVRAVGAALNKNPIPIVIPCHRVIGRTGDLTGYVAGLDVKRQLIDLELRSQFKRDRAQAIQTNDSMTLTP